MPELKVYLEFLYHFSTEEGEYWTRGDHIYVPKATVYSTVTGKPYTCPDKVITSIDLPDSELIVKLPLN